MKNYEKLTQDLLARRDRYVAEQKKRRKTAITSLCCVCFVALLGLGLWKSGVFHTTTPINGGPAVLASKPHTNATTAPTTAPTTATLPATIPTANDPIEITWVVNKVSNTLAAAKLNYNTPDYYSEKKDSAALIEYFGRDFSALGNVMPDGFQYVGGSERTFFYKIDGTPAYDSCGFLYRKGEEEITIYASKLRLPYDCLYMMDNPMPSNINGVEIIIGGIYTDSDQLDLVFADFSHKGIQYRVTVDTVPSNQNTDAPALMVDILAELIT